MTEPRKHALLSPSGAEGWMNCARKPLMEKGEPDDSNEYSDEGTCAHAIAALCLLEGEPAEAYVGRAVEVGEGRTYTFQEDMAEPVQVYVDLVRAYHGSIPGSELHVEVEVPIGHITGEEGATGTSDAVIFSPEEIIVIDLKFGMRAVSAERNKQAMLYALGAVAKFDVLGELKRVRPVIVQPRVSPKPSEWDCTIEELEEFGKTARFAAALALALYENPPGDPMVHLTVTEKGCSYCRAKDRCPAMAKYIAETLGADYTTAEGAAATPADDLAKLGAQFRALPILERYVKAVRAKAESTLFELGNSPEAIAALDIKIVQGKEGNREWTDAEAVEAKLKHWRLKKDLIYKQALHSPTQIEKMLKKHGKRGWAEQMAAMTKREPGKPSVAPADDPRPAISVVPSPEGFAVEEETA